VAGQSEVVGLDQLKEYPVEPEADLDEPEGTGQPEVADLDEPQGELGGAGE
jgi:hypothetical protein